MGRVGALVSQTACRSRCMEVVSFYDEITQQKQRQPKPWFVDPNKYDFTRDENGDEIDYPSDCCMMMMMIIIIMIIPQRTDPRSVSLKKEDSGRRHSVLIFDQGIDSM